MSSNSGVYGRLILFRLKLTMSLRTVLSVTRRPKYLLLASVSAVVLFEFLYWMLNIRLFVRLMFSPALSISDRLWLLTDPLREIFANNGVIIGVSIISLSILQGITIATIVFAIRHNEDGVAQSIGGASVAGILGAIGLGCPSCGTSLITPIVALFVSGSTASIAQGIARVIMPLSVLVGVYALYISGVKASTAVAHMRDEA